MKKNSSVKVAAGIVIKICLVLVFGALILLVQLDRASVSAPAFAIWVPSGFGGNADARRAAMLTQTDPETALMFAKTVVLNRPFPAEHLSLLAQAAIERDDVELSSAALTLAAARGWRDAYTQMSVLGAALQTKNYDIALQRLEALAKGQREQEPMIIATNYLVTEEDGRNAIAKQLTRSASYSEYILSAARATPELSAEYSDVISRATELGVKFDCALLADYTSRILSAGPASAAADIWPGSCDGTAFNDFSFELGGSSDPFGWQFESNGRVSLRSGKERGTLDVKNRDPVTRKIGHKFARLEPGRHSLKIGAANGVGSYLPPEAEIAPSLRCGSIVDSSPVALRETAQDTYEFDIPPGCTTQLLSIAIRQGSRQGLSITVR